MKASSLVKQRGRSSQVRQALGDALWGQLVAVEARLVQSPWLASLVGSGITPEAHADRLRDVLDRDRALSAVTPRESLEPARVEAREPLREPSVEIAPPEATTPDLESAPAVVRMEQAPAALPNEPICTRTMARLLAAQGHRERALAIYGVLMAKEPGDESLRAEAEKLSA
jgi:hypothetical protein